VQQQRARVGCFCSIVAGTRCCCRLTHVKAYDTTPTHPYDPIGATLHTQGKNFLYCRGKYIVVRDIAVRVPRNTLLALAHFAHLLDFFEWPFLRNAPPPLHHHHTPPLVTHRLLTTGHHHHARAHTQNPLNGYLYTEHSCKTTVAKCVLFNPLVL